MALAAVDLDDLKEINDRLGHAAGDAALGHLAITIGRNIRGGDWLARWGGDEFVEAFWDAEGHPAAERILARVADDLRRNPARLPRGGRERGGGPVQGWGKRAAAVREGGRGPARGETTGPTQNRPRHVKPALHRPGTRSRGTRPATEPGYDEPRGSARDVGDTPC